MPSPQWRTDASVIERLLDEPYRFDFFQAVRLLEGWMGQGDMLRFQNSTSLAFPASEIEALVPVADAPAHSARALVLALQDAKLKHIRIRPAFMGLLGVNGALPLHYAERIARHEHVHRDEAPRAFLDIFSNRALAMFYQAWNKYRLEQNGRLLPLLLAFAGLEPRDEHTDEVLAFHATRLQSRTVPASAIEATLAQHFGMPIRLEQFVGCWDKITPVLQTTLGGPNAILGFNATLGQRTWRHDRRVRIRIGPLARADYDRFLPRGAAARDLARMVARFAGASIEYEVQVVLRAADVKPLALNGQSRLGYDAFLAPRPGLDRGDLRYMLDLSAHDA
ncbi:MAG: type VI secretion system baseplate subunit TssG [Pseudomonadota bacterium]